jgi:PAP2 superfamily
MFARPSTTAIRPFISRLARIAAITSVATTLATAAFAEETGVARTDQSRGNAVTHWNAIALDAFAPTEGTNPMMQSRSFAILHAAIHDALNAIDRRFESYTPGLKAAPDASPDAAVAAAAREVLVTLVPEQAMLIDSAYSRALETLPDGPARTAGIATGQAAARATLTRRQNDGNETAAEAAYVPQPGPGEYQFTAPFTFALLPGWGRVQPFAIDLKQHTLEGPLPLSSVQYARDLAYLKSIGGMASTTRTPEQSEIARFWYEDSPLGWNRIANTVARQQRLDPWSTARAFALINFAMADGYIAGFEAKYRFRFWRPVTAIQETSPSWQPFLTTPPVPDYPSTHTVVGWAAAQVLMELFGDKAQYSATSLTLPGVTRHYKGFSPAAQENGMSRVYAGIHFQHAVKDGQRQGRSIGRAVAEGLAPVRSTRASR